MKLSQPTTDKLTIDQSTQVNFSIKPHEKKLQKHNTLSHFPSNFNSSWKNESNTSSNGSKMSLKHKYGSHQEKMLRTYSSAKELRLEAFPENKTSQLSSISSLVLNENRYKFRPHVAISNGNGRNYSQTSPFPHGKRIGKDLNCKCFYEMDPNDKQKVPSPTPEGLSWRRLHMCRAKLKATSTTSELLSGFAMIAMVELQINEDTQVPEWLFVVFSICTTVLVAVHIFALMISTYILPNIDAISKLDICELVTESPHERMKGFIELAWAFSTVLGLFLFLIEVAILCWVKFWDYSFTAAIAATVIIIPVLITFVFFAFHFYHSLIKHKCKTSVGDMQKLEEMNKRLDEVITA